jgi:hypothetical protein
LRRSTASSEGRSAFAEANADSRVWEGGQGPPSRVSRHRGAWVNLLVHPIAVGDGLARLCPPDEPTMPIELLSAETFKSGVLNLSYGPAKS